MAGKIVLGAGFGDEGKGLTTSFLCSQVANPLVCRFNGGHQAGHTVVYNNKRHVFSTFGSGTLQGAPTYLSHHCTFFPIAAVNEFELLQNPTLFVHPLCPITTPFDVCANQIVAKYTKDSVGVGFGKTIERQENHYNLFFSDLFYENILKAKLYNIKRYYVNTYSFFPNIDQLIEEFMSCVAIVKEFAQMKTFDEINFIYNPIFEGAQGILLDQKYGFFPHVTRSNTTSKNAFEISSEINEIFYVTRSYQTRHGNGFMTNLDKPSPSLVNNENETNKSHLYQGEFRTSLLDIELLKYAIHCDSYNIQNIRHHVKKNLVITCMDQHEIDVNALLEELAYPFHKVYISKGDSYENISLFK